MSDEVQHYDIELDRDTGLVSLGTHLFKVGEIKEGMGGSGYPNWTLDCICQDAGPDQGLHVRMNVSHSPQASWKKNEFLDAVDAPKKGKLSAGWFIGKLFRGTVTHGTYNNKPQAEITNCIPVDAPIPPTDVTPQTPQTPSGKTSAAIPSGVKAPF